ncbi:MAG TPA: phosphatase PAP2 family protein [Polyangiaceae bacterium]|nr:phosphatase PAP2 family protein [Polyangiaceae bacterium]
MRRLAALVLLGASLASATARAEGPVVVERKAAARSSLWRPSWPSFSVVEGAFTVSSGVVTLALALDDPPQEPRWKGGILFDGAVRGAMRLSSPSARQAARSIGDWPYYAAGLMPLLADPLVAWLVRDDATAAANMELIGLEAFSYAGLSSFISTRISVRERPDVTECRREHPEGGCDRDTEAFWSGHTTIVAASAGIVCANHQFMALWGSPAADASACGLATSAALVTTISRLAADRHYASDVLVGFGIGFGFGYGVPTLLHYGRTKKPVLVAIQPAFGDGAALNVAGSF